MKNKIGIMAAFFTEIPMKKRLEIIKQAGFDSFIMSIDPAHEKFTDKLENIVKYCNEIGLEIGSAHAPYKEPDVNFFWSDTKQGDDIEKVYMDALIFAKTHNIKTVVYHLHFENDYKLNMHGINRLKRMVEYAEKHDINIAVENLYSFEELDYIFTNIKSENLGFCYDTGHENFLTPNLNVIFKYGNKLKALHLNDNNGIVDQHSTIFNGNVDWSKISKGLARANKVNLDAEIRIYRPEGVQEISESQLLQLYKNEFEQLQKLEKMIEAERKLLS